MYIANLALEAQESAVKALASTVGEVRRDSLQTNQHGMGVQQLAANCRTSNTLSNTNTAVFVAVLQPPLLGCAAHHA